MSGLLRGLLCRAGRHHVIRCAGAPDHAWHWSGGRWVATLSDQRVRAHRPPAGKNDLGRHRGGR